MAQKSQLSISHLNIRQSISFVFLRLLLIEIIFAFFVILIHIQFLYFEIPKSIIDVILSGQTIIFLTILFFKFSLSLYVITAWINEYYEITSTELIHRRGFFFKHEDRFQYTNIRKIMLHQGLFGRLLNYGSLEFFDYADKVYYTLYFIHNPVRYYKLLNRVVPNHDNAKDTIRDKIIETDSDL